MAGDVFLPDWLEQGVESSLRDTEEDAPPAPLSLSSLQSPVPHVIASSNRASPVVLTPTGPSPAGSYSRPETGKAPWTDLDSFYADTHNEEGEEESEEETDNEEADEDTQDEEDESETEAEATVSGEEGSESEDDEDDDETHNSAHITR